MGGGRATGIHIISSLSQCLHPSQIYNMADFIPPSGPPPPRVPEGWKAVWNDQYKEWFYVNTHTRESSWEKPTQPAYPPGNGAPPGAPPGYDHSSTRTTYPEKGGYDNNPFNQGGQQGHNVTEDERLARQLQQEENARSASNYGQPQAPVYGQQSTSPYGQQQQGMCGLNEGMRVTANTAVSSHSSSHHSRLGLFS